METISKIKKETVIDPIERDGHLFSVGDTVYFMLYNSISKGTIERKVRHQAKDLDITWYYIKPEGSERILEKRIHSIFKSKQGVLKTL